MSDLPSRPIRQLVYRSISANTGPALIQDMADILAVSRTNNGIEGISGILLAGGGRFIQVLEGSSESVELVFSWIQADRRHSDLTIVNDDLVERRAFGSWTMANLDHDDREQVAFRLDRFLMGAEDHVREAFAGSI